LTPQKAELQLQLAEDGEATWDRCNIAFVNCKFVNCKLQLQQAEDGEATWDRYYNGFVSLLAEKLEKKLAISTELEISLLWQ
jgi:hypothetical protein